MRLSYKEKKDIIKELSKLIYSTDNEILLKTMIEHLETYDNIDRLDAIYIVETLEDKELDIIYKLKNKFSIGEEYK